MPRLPKTIDRRRALYASTAWLIGPLLPMNSVLARVLIDETDPAIAELAESLVRGRATPRERAVAIHDYVRDQIRFGFAPHFYTMSAADVLAAGIGYGNTKSTLFMALLRAAGLEARQQFVDLDATVWRGLLDLRTPFVDHSYVEVLLGGAWIATDSYAVDARLVRASQAALRAEGRRFGYGVRVDGRIDWDGRVPSFMQFAPACSRHRWGVFTDVADFYESVPEAWNYRSDAMRVIFPLGALTANQAADMLRTHGASAVRSGKWKLRS